MLSAILHLAGDDGDARTIANERGIGVIESRSTRSRTKQPISEAYHAGERGVGDGFRQRQMRSYG